VRRKVTSCSGLLVSSSEQQNDSWMGMRLAFFSMMEPKIIQLEGQERTNLLRSRCENVHFNFLAIFFVLSSEMDPVFLAKARSIVNNFFPPISLYLKQNHEESVNLYSI